MLSASCECAMEPQLLRAGSRMKIHLLLMLHDVEGFQPGLYLLQRARDEMLPGFVEPPLMEVLALQGCTLWRLAAADVHHAAQLSACGQDIATKGSFAAAFVGNFHGWTHPRNYAELLWQSGALGQVLYLAAEAAGFGATGMGCFMDDITLALLRSPWAMESKAKNDSQSFAPMESQYQVLYHFAVGKPSVDPRLLSFEAYQHLQDGFYYEALQGGMGRIVQASPVGAKMPAFFGSSNTLNGFQNHLQMQLAEHPNDVLTCPACYNSLDPTLPAASLASRRFPVSPVLPGRVSATRSQSQRWTANAFDTKRKP